MRAFKALNFYMVVIKKVKRNKKSYTIVVGEETLKNVNVEVALSYRIQEGEMDTERFKEFLKENARACAKTYTYGMLARKDRTVKEVREKLYERGFHKDAVEYAIASVSKYGYLNDEEYALSYVERALSHKGSYRIRQELKRKGVGEEEINLALRDVEFDDQFENALELAKKHLRGKSLEDEKVKEKLFRFLASRGYNYDIIKKVMRSIGAEIEEYSI